MSFWVSPLGQALSVNRANRLVLGVGPFLSTKEATSSAYLEFSRYLEKQLRLPVKLIATSSWDELSELMANGQVHLALMTPLTYVIAHHRHGANLIATLLSDGKPYFRGIIVVNSHSGISSIEQLRGKTFAFGNRGAFSGYLLPLDYLRRTLHIESADFIFSKVSYDNPWVEVEKQVAVQAIDAGADWDGNRVQMIEQGLLDPSDSKILWTSPPIPNDAFVASTEISRDPHLMARLRNILTSMAKSLGKGPAVLPSHSTGFVVLNNSFYLPVEEVARASGLMGPDSILKKNN
jgi:phosphonate transport system substrate-binding protein